MTRLVEKYRPERFEDIIGQDANIASIKSILARKANPHFLFLGPPGTGKTSTAVCMAKYVFGDDWRRNFKEMNASDERKIEHVRGVIKTYSRVKGQRMLYLGEADNMTQDAQQALRRIMEKTKGTIFVLSGNKKHKIITPLKSRCVNYAFNKLTDRMVLAGLLKVCKGEGIKIDEEAKAGFYELVARAKGDLRWAINSLETIVNEKKEITAKEVISLLPTNIAGSALSYALHGDFDKARELIEDAYIQSKFSVDSIIEDIYTSLSTMDVDKTVTKEIIVRLYSKLAETERGMRNGCDPKVQLIGFMVYAWVAPHLTKCPVFEQS